MGSKTSKAHDLGQRLFHFGAQLGNTILVVCTNHVGRVWGVRCIGRVLDVFELCFQ